MKNEHSAEFLRFCNDHGIRRADGQDFMQQGDLVSVAAQRASDLCRDALVAQEPEAHAGTASNSANSRA